MWTDSRALRERRNLLLRAEDTAKVGSAMICLFDESYPSEIAKIWTALPSETLYLV